MLTFIKLDHTHILYGDVMIQKFVDGYVGFFGLSAKVDDDHGRFVEDKDGSIWYGLCAISVNLPRKKTDE